MVGHKFIDNLINHESADQYEVITFSEEPRLAYDRVQLSAYFSGSTADDLMLTSEAYYEENGVKYVLNEKVVELKTEEK
jgi:assimilatory nitrite reductase (NAD(P)H) large subunit precursor (EC 1.7.1.4)